MSMADEPASPSDPVTRDYVVHGPCGELTVSDVAEIEVGERAELVLKGADGGCAAIVAPGHWWHARVCDDPAAEDA